VQSFETQLRQMITEARAMAASSVPLYDAILARLAAKTSVDSAFYQDFAHLLPPQNLQAEPTHTAPPPIPADQWPTQGAPFNPMHDNPRLREALRRDGT